LLVFSFLVGSVGAVFVVSRYLSYEDRTGEIAFAVLMVIIINGYVALSDLNSGFGYIVAVNLGACFGWGMIDGLVYAVSSSIERNRARNRLVTLKQTVGGQDTINKVIKNLDDTFLASFDDAGKKAVAGALVEHVGQADFGKAKVLTKDDIGGWLSILGIYLTVGLLMALPFLVLSDKFLAWVISNSLGVAWVTWYGIQLGKAVGKYRWLLGLILGATAVMFLVVSYFVWT
jgi:VIT1/CCC1 family predicted Fe2+/Mn2+ transporter